jgi:hypothetical protein
MNGGGGVTSTWDAHHSEVHLRFGNTNSIGSAYWSRAPIIVPAPAWHTTTLPPWQQQRLRQILFDGNIAMPSATAKNSLAQSTSRNRRRPAQGCRWYSEVRASR